eukprot:364209-Chlamydomonas_euryale.AAC.2
MDATAKLGATHRAALSCVDVGCCCCALLCGPQVLGQAFAKLDTDGSGYLDGPELVAALRIVEPKLTTEELRVLLAYLQVGTSQPHGVLGGNGKGLPCDTPGRARGRVTTSGGGGSEAQRTVLLHCQRWWAQAWTLALPTSGVWRCLIFLVSLASHHSCGVTLCYLDVARLAMYCAKLYCSEAAQKERWGEGG